MHASLLKKTLLLILVFVMSGYASPAHAQQTGAPAEKPPVFCDRARALALVEEKASESKSLEKAVARIGVLVRAAELLWADDETSARALFAEAYELASAHYMERGDEIIREKLRADHQGGGLGRQLPDQRFVVIRAVARRDSVWAQKLSDRAAVETRAYAEKKAERERERVRNVGEKFLQTATGMLDENLPAALALARQSLREDATQMLPYFLYEAAKRDRAAADALYADALAAYSTRSVESLLHLSAYPFAVNRLVGQGLSYGVFPTPPRFTPNPDLQRRFVAAFLALTERELRAAQERVAVAGPTNRPSEIEKALTALLTLDTLYAPNDPTFASRAMPLKELAGMMLASRDQQRADSNSQLDLTMKTGDGDASGRLDRALEQAEKVKDPERRDMQLIMGLQSAFSVETPERIAAAAEKISDSETRRQFLNFAYFMLAQRAVREERFDEATALSEKIEALDERALVKLEIAAAGIKKNDDRQRASELLESVIKSTREASDTVEKARALLGVAHLYAKFDYQRSLEVLGDAVKIVNKLDEPDFNATNIIRRIEGKTFATYTSSPVPGFNLENAFREVGTHGFENTLAVASELKDKSLRSIATLSLVTKCLEETKPQEKPDAKPTRKQNSKQKPAKTE